VNVDSSSTNNIKSVIEYLKQTNTNFEIIICNDLKKHDSTFIETVKLELTNTFYYEFSNFEEEQLMTAALDQAIGDVIFEFYNLMNILDIFQDMFELSESLNCDFTYYPIRRNWRDKMISLIASYFLGVKIKTFIDWPRVSKRDSLNKWNTLNSKSKLIKLNTYLFNRKINYVTSNKKINYNLKRFIRISLRTLVYGSSSPLRLVTIVASLGSLMSFVVSMIILFISFTKDVVTGWTTTNLLISLSTLLILFTLSIVSEYINQIVNTTKSLNGVDIVFEISSNDKNFQEKLNVEKM